MIVTLCTYIGLSRKVTSWWHEHGFENRWHLTVWSSTLLPSSTLTCQNCGYEHLDVHRTNGSLITYCQRCGNSSKEKRTPERRQWTEVERKLHRKRIAFLREVRKRRR